MKRTGSIGSCVGPEVTTTRRPASAPLDSFSRVSVASTASIAATIASGSAMRPGPYSPQAIAPSSGPQNSTPSACSVATLRCVAGCSHIRRFIAGATSVRLSVASSSVVARSSARPLAMRASRLAVAGATTTRSAARDSSIWPISASSVSEKRCSCTFSPARLAKDSGVTNSFAPAVSTGTTRAPRSRSRRTRSSVLYAAIPPPTTRRMVLLVSVTLRSAMRVTPAAPAISRRADQAVSRPR